MKRQWEVKERQWNGSGRSRKGSEEAVGGQGKAVKWQWEVKDRQWNRSKGSGMVYRGHLMSSVPFLIPAPIVQEPIPEPVPQCAFQHPIRWKDPGSPMSQKNRKKQSDSGGTHGRSWVFYRGRRAGPTAGNLAVSLRAAVEEEHLVLGLAAELEQHVGHVAAVEHLEAVLNAAECQ